jgi:hypothetical protein
VFAVVVVVADERGAKRGYQGGAEVIETECSAITV